MSTGPTNVMNAGRDDYTWDMAERDLTLMTRLNLQQAAGFVRPLRRLDLNPYDALPTLHKLVSLDQADPETLGEILHELIAGKPYLPWQEAS